MLDCFEKEELRGVILADAAGLGKTWEIIGFFLKAPR